MLEALRRAEPGAAEALYRLLLPSIAHALFRVLGSSADRDDLTQITFERVLRTLTRGGFNRSCGVRHWAASIATYAAIDHLRADRTRRSVLVPHEDVSAIQAVASVDPERTADARNQLTRLRELMGRMKPLDASVLLLFDGLGYTIKEVAAALGVSRDAAQSRLVRARRKLVEGWTDGAESGSAKRNVPTGTVASTFSTAETAAADRRKIHSTETRGASRRGGAAKGGDAIESETDRAPACHCGFA